MSRVGKHPIALPSGVSVEVNGQQIKAKGKLGELFLELPEKVSLVVNDNQITVSPVDESKEARMRWGTSRNLVRNLVQGVHEGFTVNLEINGVGYRAAVQGKELVLQLGYSHDVHFPVPHGITIKCEKPTSVAIHGMDRQKVGQVAAEIRSFRPPEPYKGKGIKYNDEVIVRKEGKKK
jgi:large subunit ribosomal protein L6